jgi:hypothetical protein
MADVQFLGKGDPRGYATPSVTFSSVPAAPSGAAQVDGIIVSVSPTPPPASSPSTASNVAGLALPPVPLSLSPSAGVAQPLSGLLNPFGVPTNAVFDLKTVPPNASVPQILATVLTGQRIRFTTDTTTVALRGVARDIAVNTATTVTLAAILPAVPVLADVCFIEENPSTIVRRTPVLEVILS